MSLTPFSNFASFFGLLANTVVVLIVAGVFLVVSLFFGLAFSRVFRNERPVLVTEDDPAIRAILQRTAALDVARNKQETDPEEKKHNRLARCPDYNRDLIRDLIDENELVEILNYVDTPLSTLATLPPGTEVVIGGILIAISFLGNKRGWLFTLTDGLVDVPVWFPWRDGMSVEEQAQFLPKLRQPCRIKGGIIQGKTGKAVKVYEWDDPLVKFGDVDIAQ